MSKPSPSPTPYADDTQPAAEGQPVKAGDYTIISSVEVGARAGR